MRSPRYKMSDWCIRESDASSISPTCSVPDNSSSRQAEGGGGGFLVYVETHSKDPRRHRCTCLSEAGNVPLACVEHTDIITTVIADFVDERRESTTWLCVFHGEEHVDTIGRSAIGLGATILTAYPLGQHGDAAPRVSPLFGVKVRSARQGVSGAYVFGSAPPMWKVPLATRAQSVIGTWVGSTQILMGAAMMNPTMVGGGGGRRPSTGNARSVSSSAAAASSGSANVNAWCLLSPYTLVPIFVCGTSPDLDGCVVAEFILPGDATIVVFLTSDGVLKLFAVEVAATGDAVIWHVIPGEFNFCQPWHHHRQQHSGGGAAAAEDDAAPAIINNLSDFSCDEVQCEHIASADPLRYILCLRFPRSRSLVVLETPPLRTENAFFPLDPPKVSHYDTSHHLQQQQQRDQNLVRHDGAVATTNSVPSSRSASVNNNPTSTAPNSSHHSPAVLGADEEHHHHHYHHRAMMMDNNDDDASSSPTRQHEGFTVLEGKLTSVAAVFKWTPVRGFVPFVVVVSDVVAADDAPGPQQQQQQQAVATVYARGSPSPRQLDKIATFNRKTTNQISACHVALRHHASGGGATTLLGPQLMVRDSGNSMWSTDQTLPQVMTPSVEYLALRTLSAVLPQHFEVLYRHCVAAMLQKRENGGEPPRFFDILTSFFSLNAATAATSTKQQKHEGEHVPQSLQPDENSAAAAKRGGGAKMNRKLFSPWRNGVMMTMASATNTTTTTKKDAARPRSPATVITRQSLQLAVFALHILTESLKVDRLMSQQLSELSFVVLRLSEMAGLPRYTALYRDSLLAFSHSDVDSESSCCSCLLDIDLVRQFFDGVGEGGDEASSSSSSSSASSQSDDGFLANPMDLLACLRWISEGLEPVVRQWPRIKTWHNSDAHHHQNAASGERKGGSFDPFLNAATVFAFFVLNNRSSSNNNTSSGAEQCAGSSVDPAAIIERAVQIGWDCNTIETKLPAGIARSVYQAVAQCGERISAADYSAFAPAALDLMGREDILVGSHAHNFTSSGPSAAPERRVQREVVMFCESLARHVEACAVGSSLAQVIETEAPAGPFSQVRTEKVHALLSATSPIPLPANVDPAEAIQTTLPLLVRRAVAVSVGRGMLHLSTHNFRERDRVPVPPLVLTGLTADGLVITCEQRLVSPETMRWPTFHNACAAALRFLPLMHNNNNNTSPITRHWIVHQARDTQHRAGVLLAVGLLGHLSSLQLTDIYSIFVAPSAQDPQREPLTIAMLLGLGCSFRGTRSEAVFRCLAVHLQSLTPNGEDVEVSLDVQSASLVALGLVFEGTAQSFLVDMLLNDMSRPPSDQLSRQREGYALASGAALGLVLLGHGRNHNLSHMGIEERLLALLDGERRDMSRAHLFRPDSVYGDVTDGVVFPNGDEKFLTRALVSQARVDAPEPCNTVFEGKKFNTQITGPAAAIALGLMFIKTRDEWIARHMDLPSTLPLIDGVSPQLTLLRVLCAGLIRWPEAAPADMVESFLPGCLVKLIPLLKTSTQARELDTQAQYRSLHLGYAHAGAALAVGMTFAGTLLAEVKALLLATLEGFAEGRVGSTGVPQAMIHKKSHAFDPCLASAAIAVSLVSAGTGDPDVLRVLTGLLKRGNFTYGIYMAISSAIGLLFLGGGRCTLSNTPQSVASLLLAFYPQWPGTALDNTFHLQAMRHFYAMSVVPRWLSTFDVDSGRPVTTSARIVMVPTAAGQVSLAFPENRDVADIANTWTPMPKAKQAPTQQQPAPAPTTAFAVVTPCLLPEITTIDRIEVREPGFFTLTISNSQALHSRSIGVKQKPQLFFGTTPRVFGPNSWDAAIRDSVVSYNRARLFTDATFTASIAIQDLALLAGSLPDSLLSGNNMNSAAAVSSSAVGFFSLSVASPSNSLSASSMQLLQALSAVFNDGFIAPILENPAALHDLLSVVHRAKSNTSTNFSLVQEVTAALLKRRSSTSKGGDYDARRISEWLSHALRYCNLHQWWPNRVVAFEKLLQQQQGGDEDIEALFESAVTGKFCVSVATCVSSTGGDGATVTRSSVHLDPVRTD